MNSRYDEILPSRPKSTILLAIVLLAATLANAQKPQSLPQPTDYVSDLAGVLSQETRQKLNLLAGEVEQKTGAQIAVVTVKSLEEEEASQYANELFKIWGIGGKKNDRGILILLAPNERKYWTEVGYGLEPIINDAKVGSFGREMAPDLKAGDYNSALTLLATRVAQTIAADAGVTLTGVPDLPRRRQQDGRVSSLFVFLFILFIIIMISRAGRRRGGRWMGPMIFPGGGFGGGGFGGGGWSGGGGFGSGSGFGGFGGGSSGGGGAGGSW